MHDQIQAVIYDMGGVFLRSESYISRIALAKTYGLSLQQLEDQVFDSKTAQLATLGKISEESHWNSICDTLNVPVDNREDFQTAFWQGDQLDRDLIDFLGSLRPALKTGLLSNAWSNARQALTEKHQCRDVFDVYLFSCEVGLAKPDPAIYKLILERLGVKAREAIFLDDNVQNVGAAAKLGIHAIRFLNHTQALQDIQALL
jgi:putative hydrolase of the HAD superfamily